MSNKISKTMSDKDGTQVLQASYNDTDGTLSTSGFITSKLGNKITVTALDSTNDQFDYYADGSIIYSIKITYNNSAHDSVTAMERIA